MKTIYLCQSDRNIRRIYSTDAQVFTKEDVLENPDAFRETACIFSTWGMPVFTEDEIKGCFPSLQAVFYGAGTVQSFARPFLNCGVRVFSAWAANAVPVAEYAAAQIVLANKGFFRVLDYAADPRAGEVYQAYPGNYGVKVGILGAGMIGKLVIQKLRALDVEILVFDPFLPDATAQELGVEKTSLAEVFARCQVVSNHLANNAQTRGMLDGALFESMLPYATFLNTGRGAQVVEADLIRVLRARPDLTAILDVTDPEPPTADSPLRTLPNCILTPHMAGSSGNEVRRMGKYMETEYENYCAGRPCQYEVTAQMLKTMA